MRTDTLFFRRRLVIEGDTELGLAVKNLLEPRPGAPAALVVERRGTGRAGSAGGARGAQGPVQGARGG